jgi:hypothetical protein
MSASTRTTVSSPAEQRMHSMRCEGKGTQVVSATQFFTDAPKPKAVCTPPERAWSPTWVPFPSRRTPSLSLRGFARPGMTNVVNP